ncbi:MAG: FHA domain-containing protein [Vicinamibacteria bacterium]|nr:FHA domain-containing protein [Vicinamibacteria bacterium]
MAQIVINPTSASRREISLQHAALAIGRDPSNDLVLTDAMVSRRHAVIEFRGDRFFLRDCSSSNGSLVNGDRITECRLKDGDLIAMGATRILFQAEAEADTVEFKPEAEIGGRRFCPQCHAVSHAEDQYCRQCGATIISGPAAKMLCSLCGSIVILPARYCHSCGTELCRENDRLATTRPLHVVTSLAATPRSSVSGESVDPTPHVIPADPEPGSARDDSRVLALTASFIEPAGACRRLAAASIDAIIVLLGMLLLLSPAIYFWWPFEVVDVSYFPVLLTCILAMISLLLGALYHVYFWGVHGATPGKKMLGLVIQTKDGVVPVGVGRATLRLFGYGLSAASLGIGFLLIAFAGHGLHDHLAGTRVVRQDLS